MPEFIHYYSKDTSELVAACGVRFKTGEEHYQRVRSNQDKVTCPKCQKIIEAERRKILGK
ncbi:MAG TPA: hypothetical protein VEH27_00720 [Methylomirabilota bacterium]|nr:hypothetical protein [Methylomirabilota bacterium]